MKLRELLCNCCISVFIGISNGKTWQRKYFGNNIKRAKNKLGVAKKTLFQIFTLQYLSLFRTDHIFLGVYPNLNRRSWDIAEVKIKSEFFFMQHPLILVICQNTVDLQYYLNQRIAFLCSCFFTFPLNRSVCLSVLKVVIVDDGQMLGL